MERTLIIIKPDGMDRQKKIISYYENAGLKIIAEKKIRIDRKMAERHYAATDQQISGMGNKTIQASKDSGQYENMKKIFGTENAGEIGTKLRGWLIKFITSATVTALVLEGDNSVAAARKITGFTDPAKAEKGTVRGDLGADSIVKANMEGRPVKNLVHASGSSEEARREIALWFPGLEGTTILFDTNIYGWAVEDKNVLRILSFLIKGKNRKLSQFKIFGSKIIKNELRKNPHESTRIKTLKFYNSVVSKEIKGTKEAKNLAYLYFEACKEARVKITIEDCEIVAAATINEIDFIVTNNRRTMNNPEALKIFKKINSDKFITPKIINSGEASTMFSF